MKVLVYGLNFAPELIGIGKYTHEMCEWLSAQGHSVKVVCGYPFYPRWNVEVPYRNASYSEEIRQDIQITRCPLYVPTNPTGLRRLVSHLSFALSSAPAVIFAALRFHPDVVFTIAPSQVIAPAALAASSISGAKSWLHIQDFEIESAFGLKILTGNWLRRCAEFIESTILKRFDRVSTISPKMMERLLGKKVSPARTVEFRNWVDTTDIKPGERLTPLRAELALPPDAVVALYSGSMALKQGLQNVIEAARILNDAKSKIIFILCGNGVLRDRLDEESKKLGNIRILDLLPKERLSELLSTADIHLLPQRAAVADLVLPSKLAATLASGRPVVAMAETGTQLATEVEDSGLIIPADDSGALVAALLRLADDVALRDRFGQHGRIRAQNRWDIELILGRLEQDLLRLAQIPPNKSSELSGRSSNGVQKPRANDIATNSDRPKKPSPPDSAPRTVDLQRSLETTTLKG